MKRFIIASLAYVLLCFGICAALIAGLNFVAFHVGSMDGFYISGGVAIIAFVISWLLLKISRQK